MTPSTTYHVILLYTLCVLYCTVSYAHPFTASLSAPSTPQKESNNNNINNRRNIFQIPPGIFTSFAAADAQTMNSVADDADGYVPYRSDVHDHFAWALFKKILLSTTAITTTLHNNTIAANTNANAFIGSSNTENIIFSPFSVKLVLALLIEATGPGTHSQQQLLTTLGDIKEIENLHNFYSKILTSLKRENPHYTLRLETRFYTDSSINTQQSYRTLLQSAYQTSMEQLNFADGAASAEVINSWIARVTEGCLQQLVTEEGVANSVMLLVNAIYFNGMWRRQFTESYQGAFFPSSNVQLKAQYMEQTDTFFYHHCDKLKAQIVRLPYRGQKFSMFIVLPSVGQSVDSLLSRMEYEQLKHMQWMMERTKLKVVLPKFKYGYKTDLKAVLTELGIVDIFTDNAQLTGMVADEDSRLMVSNILQKSGIDVNEQGTEAYAATEVEIVNRFGGNEDVEEILVNRPFVFFIEEDSTGNILFAGKVLDPKA